MVASSKSSRGRPSLRSDLDHRDQEASQARTSSALTHQHDLAPTQHGTRDDQVPSRVKRNRVASVSDHESLQKRRRTSKDTAPPPLAIPLRGRSGAQPNCTVTRNSPGCTTVRPQIVTQDSQTSISSAQSPLNSPYARPQYDQFKRIEEKAQKVVQRNISNAAFHDDKRKLRSEHGSTRSKTELAQYFPGFDEMLSLEPADPNTLTAKTPVVLIDDTPSFQPGPPQPDYFRCQQAPHNSQVIDLQQYAIPLTAEQDPLADHVYHKAHQKAERHEKQMKNGDKERAQHEKYQLERLLEELRGPDWLKTLGISGITDTEKKRYEVKRTLFIKETKALIDKFRRWKDEERKRKLEKQQLLLEEMEASAAESGHGDDKTSTSTARRPTARPNFAAIKNRSRPNSRTSSIKGADHACDPSEIDALASQQLLKEAKMANQLRKKASTSASPVLLAPPLEIADKPFTSFFEKRHIRDAALSGRNRGRKSYAFGQEVPEFEEQDFELPEYILTEDAIKTSQRSRRRRMRATDD